MPCWVLCCVDTAHVRPAPRPSIQVAHMLVLGCVCVCSCSVILHRLPCPRPPARKVWRRCAPFSLSLCLHTCNRCLRHAAAASWRPRAAHTSGPLPPAHDTGRRRDNRHADTTSCRPASSPAAPPPRPEDAAVWRSHRAARPCCGVNSALWLVVAARGC